MKGSIMEEKKVLDFDVSQLKSALENEKRERANICGKELEELLSRHNCALDITMEISSVRGIIPKIVIVPRDPVESQAK